MNVANVDQHIVPPSSRIERSLSHGALVSCRSRPGPWERGERDEIQRDATSGRARTKVDDTKTRDRTATLFYKRGVDLPLPLHRRLIAPDEQPQRKRKHGSVQVADEKRKWAVNHVTLSGKPDKLKARRRSRPWEATQDITEEALKEVTLLVCT